MATRAELEKALRAADAAGAADDARRLSAALANYTENNNAPPPPNGAEVYSQMPLWQKALTPVADAGRLIGKGATLGGYDKLAGIVAPLIGGSDVEGQRKLTQDARDRGGVGGNVLELGSSILPALLTDGATTLPALGNSFKGLLAKAGVAGAEGAGYGGIQASNEDQNVVEGMKSGAAFGVGGHAVAGSLSAAFNKIGDLFSGTPKRLSVDELKAQKDAAYQNVTDMGVNYTPGTIRGMLAGMDTAAQPYPGRHDQVIAAKNQVRHNVDIGTRPVSLPEVDLNRQIIGRDLNSLPDRAQQDMGIDITDAIDAHLDQVGPLGVTARSGDPVAGLDEMNRARGLNQRMRKLENIEAVTDKSQLQADKSLHQGFDSTMRNNVAGILTNPKKARGYTPDENAQMREVVSGTTRQNIERQLGRMAPGGGLSFGGAGTAASLAGLLSGGNPVMAGAAATIPPAIGWVAKKLSERGTKNSAQKLLDLVASGGNKAAITPPKSMTPKDRDKLGRIMMMLQLHQSQ